jgi:hypothetical protein
MICLEKDLDKRNLGLSLQPAFIKRGCSLQIRRINNDPKFLIFFKKNLVVITTVLSSPPVQQNGCSLKQKKSEVAEKI